MSTRARIVMSGCFAALVLILVLRALGYAEQPEALAAGRAWAVGEGGIILHFDGTAWRPMESGVTTRLSSVSGTSPKDIWAVGQSKVLHFDGTRWTKIETNHGWETLTTVWARTPKDVWVAGDEGITLHWDGRTWTRHPLAGGARMNVYALHGTAANDVWGLAAGGAWVIRWNGKEWTDGTWFTGRSRGALWPNAPDDAWLVHGGSVFRWHGKEWEREGNFDYIPAASLLAYGPDELWAAGGRTIYQRLKGVWSKMPLPDLEDYDRFYSLAKARDGRAWVVGSNGRILHYAGGKWSRDESGTRVQLVSVWAY